jgi:hypothetical protein
MKEAKGIVLNRMFVGDYLSANLGHEVINLYQADNGRNYLYLNATGNFVEEHQGRIGYMLLVKFVKMGVLEVLGMATGLHDVFNASIKIPDIYKANKEIIEDQKKYIAQEGSISYYDASISDIFNAAEQQNIFITYRADKVYIPKEKRIYIVFSQDYKEDSEFGTQDCIVAHLEGYRQAKASLKQYIYPEGAFSANGLKDKDIAEKRKDYQTLYSTIVSNQTIWAESNVKVTAELIKRLSNTRKVSLFDICQIQNSETAFSNALSYFMLQTEYRSLWRDFFKDCCNIQLTDNYTVSREEQATIEDKMPKYKKLNSGGRIDLLIRDKRSFIIIENKIKSDINSIESDDEGAQLERYWNYVNWLKDQKETERNSIYPIVLTPNYNSPKIEGPMKDKWKIVTYGQLYNYLTAKKETWRQDPNFEAFYNAIQRHTYANVNDYLYYEMQDKFIRRILDCK